MTDERLGDALLPTIAALPRGSGIIFRHYNLDQTARLSLFKQVSTHARRARHMLVVGGDRIKAPRWQIAGWHGRQHGALTAPVHSRREAVAATRAGARLLLVSPLFASRSHPGGRALGRSRFGLMIRDLRRPVIALGGVTGARARGLRPMRVYGWAAIDGLARHARKQNRLGQAVPI